MAFRSDLLASHYRFLDDCPDCHVEGLLALSSATLRQRVAGLVVWRGALLRGELPGTEHWPCGHGGESILKLFGEIGLARFCRGAPELVDELLCDVLNSLKERQSEFEKRVTKRAEELAAEEREALALHLRQKLDSMELDQRRLFLDRQLAGAAATRQKRAWDLVSADKQWWAPSGLDCWSKRCAIWRSLDDVFGSLGMMLWPQLGWDLSLGVLQHVGWREMERLADLLKKAPQLSELVRQLGRLAEGDSSEHTMETVLTPIRRMEEYRQEVFSPLVPAETRGIERSGDIQRMLPSEAGLMRHPKLRYLWHARRAERSLVSYRIEGTEIERSMIEVESLSPTAKSRPRPIRGPIVVVVDTSGSMTGFPEVAAKAVALETLRVAHSEGRRCYLYAFSATRQFLEHQLDLTPQGVGRLLDFLSFTFGGGTDVGVLEHVSAKLAQPDWNKADVLMVTDGEWQASRVTTQSVKSARSEGTRFHCVLVKAGGYEHAELFDHTHRFYDWNFGSSH